jgi:hypothetical protein
LFVFITYVKYPTASCALLSSMSHDRIWRLIRQPFIFPTTPRLPHTCKWEIFAAGRAGCTLCGAIHVCDSLTCEHKIVTDDSILCSITGFFLNRLYGAETWSDRSVCVSLDSRNKIELSYDVDTYVHDLLLSSNAKLCTLREQDSYVQRLSNAIDHFIATRSHGFDCATDVLASALQSIQWRVPPEFCAVEREKLAKTCTAAIHASATMLFKNRYFKICRGNQKAIVFGLVYLLRTGVTHDTKIILPRIDHLCAVLPLETQMKGFFGVSPSSITDTENRLKFIVRQNSAA